MFSDQPVHVPPQKINILVAVDDPAVRAGIRRLLHGRGYVILEAGDGEQALQAARAWPEPLHLLITAIHLPKLPGDELAQRLLELRGETKVLFLSGYGDEVIVGHNLIGPKSAFLHMPFGHPDLFDLVQALLDGSAFACRAFKPSLRGVLAQILQST